MKVTHSTYDALPRITGYALPGQVAQRPEAADPSRSHDSGQGDAATRTGQHPEAASDDRSQTTSREGQASQPLFGTEQLSPEERRMVETLKQIDTEVRNHEMAHVTAGGAHITSGASFSYKTGPDGKKYAVAGEVSIDTSPVPGDPEATMRKMRQIRQAALAPADPSAQDQRVAANAAAQSLKALSELNLLRAEQLAEQREDQAFGPSAQQAADSYARVNTLPESGTSTVELAV